MKRALAILVIALALYADADALRAADVRVARISRTETPMGIAVVYYVEAAGPVVISATGEYTVTPIQDGATWRATVKTVLDACDGALVIDGATVEQQRCTWFPVVGRE